MINKKLKINTIATVVIRLVREKRNDETLWNEIIAWLIIINYHINSQYVKQLPHLKFLRDAKKKKERKKNKEIEMNAIVIIAIRFVLV